MDETIDELKAGWEAVREKVNALQLTAQFYAERNQQLIDENRELKSYIKAADRSISDLAEVQVEMNELLWWLTAEANRVCLDRYGVGKHGGTVQLLIASVVRQMLATQGYTRENLEKH